MSNLATGWTEDRVEQLKKLWDAGLSATQVAAELGGGLSRNAVIGKVHRLGLALRGKKFAGEKVAKERKVRREKVFKPRVVVKPEAGIVEEVLDPSFDPDNVSAFDAAIPQEQRLGLQQLTDETCKWPVGDPQAPEFFFCGGHSLPGLPYCAPHSRAAFTPAHQARQNAHGRVRARRRFAAS